MKGKAWKESVKERGDVEIDTSARIEGEINSTGWHVTDCIRLF